MRDCVRVCTHVCVCGGRECSRKAERDSQVKRSRTRGLLRVGTRSLAPRRSLARSLARSPARGTFARLRKKTGLKASHAHTRTRAHTHTHRHPHTSDRQTAVGERGQATVPQSHSSSCYPRGLSRCVTHTQSIRYSPPPPPPSSSHSTRSHARARTYAWLPGCSKPSAHACLWGSQEWLAAVGSCPSPVRPSVRPFVRSFVRSSAVRAAKKAQRTNKNFLENISPQSVRGEVYS